MFPLDEMLGLREVKSEDPKLIIRIFEVTQLIWPQIIIVTDGRTDGRTDRQHTTALLRFAVRASRGKNEFNTALWATACKDLFLKAGPKKVL